MNIDLKPGTLVILIGPSGSGKTTFARSHFLDSQVVSSDGCRALVSDTEEFQPYETAAAFRLFYMLLEERLRLGRVTVADSTGLLRPYRRRMTAIAHDRNLPTVAVVFDTPEQVCVERDAQRGRTVGCHVIRRQLRELRNARRAIMEEGFDQVITVTEGKPVLLTCAGSSLRERPTPKAADRSVFPVPERLNGAGGKLLARAREFAGAGDVLHRATGSAPEPNGGQPSLLPPPILSAACGLGAADKGRLLLRALPRRGRPVLGTFAASNDAAADWMGESHPIAAIHDPWGIGRDSTVQSIANKVQEELVNGGAFSRANSGVIAMDLWAWRDGSRWHLAPVAPAWPPPASTSHSEAFLWEWLDLDALSIAMEPTDFFLGESSETSRAIAWAGGRTSEVEQAFLVVQTVRDGDVEKLGIGGDGLLRPFDPECGPPCSSQPPEAQWRELAMGAMRAGDFEAARAISQLAPGASADPLPTSLRE